MSESQLYEAEREVELRSNHLGRLNNEYSANVNTLENHYAPKMAPLSAAVYRGKQEQADMECRVRWLEKKVVVMEQKRHSFLEGRDLAPLRKEALDSLVPAIQEACAVLESATKEELAVLRGYENPPQLVVDTITVVLQLRGEEDLSWDAAKIMLSETYYYSFFVYKTRTRVKQEISSEVYEVLCKYCDSVQYTPASMMLVSRPCGGMSLWLHAVRDYFRMQMVSEPHPQSIDAVKSDLHELRTKLQQKKEDTLETEKKLQVLQNELAGELMKLRDKYDETLLPLQELFFEAHQRFNAVYASPRRDRDAHSITAE